MAIIKILFFRIFLVLTAHLPLRLLHGLSGPLSTLLVRLPNRAGRTTLRNLRVCFPELDEAGVRDLARDSLRHSLCALFEMGRAWVWPMPRMVELIREAEGVDEFRGAVAAGDGVVLLAPHLGSWEIFGISMCYGLHAHFLYMPPDDPALDRLLLRSRARGGLRMAAGGQAGVGKLLRALRAGELVGILPDQVPADGSGVFAPFFAQPAYTMTLACKLAQRPGARVFCGYAKRLPAGAGFRAVIRELDLRRENLDESITAMNQAIEEMVRECPEQYQWEYKRFRRQPDDSEFY
ncbi:MAG: lysophospholipid acyltransferase family protein [Gammaproteobacteria bacterium]|nr:lysophospholipid acyltransferase family protein [Gammaproteobacteria bacterium]MYG97121.1 lysophospholipid acyltransferase family protein [Gammaproteobacteria bacterium]